MACPPCRDASFQPAGCVSSRRMSTPAAVTVPTDTPFTAGPGRRSGARSYAVPLVVAVTGHRDLVAEEVEQIRARVRGCLLGLRSDSPGRIISVMSALAEGADRLVAEEALSLG